MSDPHEWVPASTWHPIEQARPHGSDELLCMDEWMGEWAIIRPLTFEGETWYRSVTYDEDPAARELIGYSQDLRALAKHSYLRFMHRRTAAPARPVDGWMAYR